MECYLKNRTQIVCVSKDSKNYYSETKQIQRGVSQGSILGPLLFILFVNDLLDGFDEGLVCQYVDDTSLLVAGRSFSNLSRICTQSATQMAQWCTNNSLKLNTEKTGLLVFAKRENQESPLVILNHKSVPIADSVRFLGVTLDSHLTWEQHISQLNSKLNSACAIIRRLKNVVSLHCLRVYYLAHVQSLLNYGICFWGSLSNWTL